MKYQKLIAMIVFSVFNSNFMVVYNWEYTLRYIIIHQPLTPTSKICSRSSSTKWSDYRRQQLYQKQFSFHQA